MNQQQLQAFINKSNSYPLEIYLHIFESLPSTNSKLWEMLDRGEKAGTVVITSVQTAGKGQWGRQWHSAEGGLYLSLAFGPNLETLNAAQITISSAWGIATALRNYGIPVLIKWPNDLILQGRKLGGILTETRMQQGRITKAIAGVGINWDNPVPETGINLQSFQQSSKAIACLEKLAAIVLEGLLSGYQCLTTQGIESLLPSYHQLLTSQGRAVLVDGQPGVVTGVTINGDLRVKLENSISEVILEPGKISLGYDV